MRKSLSRGLPTLFLAGLLTSLALAQTPSTEEPDPAKKQSLFNRFSLFPAKKEEKKPPPPSKKNDKEDPARVQQKAEIKMVEMAAALQAAERAVWFQRQAVCDKLKKIAIQTGDEKLEQKADQLEQMAWEAFQKRTAELAAGASGSSREEQIFQNNVGKSAPGIGPGAGLTSGVSGSNGSFAARKDKK